jgi:eukaryotic-like serine/threonine-protein kinase
VALDNIENVLDRKVCIECHRQFTGIVAACPHDGTLLISVVQDPLIGTILAGNYEILSVLGQGGMGVVYKARHALMDRIVAIKMLQAQLITDSMSVKRFQHESKAASRINHPNVISVFDFGISPTGQPYIVMDFLAGTPLSDEIKKDGQIGVERTIKIMAQACDALEHAHRQGVIHRDLKPSNIVLINFDDDKDFVKVVDFGVAKLLTGTESQKLTQVGEVCGSPVYMSPEQCKGLDLDNRSDIYSMAIVVYEALTGRLPILGKTMVETMFEHVSSPPKSIAEARPDLYIPERLEAVIMKALSKDPKDRHQSMDALRADLEIAIPRAGRSQILRTTPLEQIQETSKEIRKHPVSQIVAAVAACVVCLGMVIGWTLTFRKDMKPQQVPVQSTATPQEIAPPLHPQMQSPMPIPVQLPATVTTPVASDGKNDADSKQADASTKASTVVEALPATAPVTRSHTVRRAEPAHRRSYSTIEATSRSTRSRTAYEHVEKPAKSGGDPWNGLRSLRSY